ncbi:MAG: hypothetical protein AAFR71_06490 [Pseudomonadota bacterium]
MRVLYIMLITIKLVSNAYSQDLYNFDTCIDEVDLQVERYLKPDSNSVFYDFPLRHSRFADSVVIRASDTAFFQLPFVEISDEGELEMIIPTDFAPSICMIMTLDSLILGEHDLPPDLLEAGLGLFYSCHRTHLNFGRCTNKFLSGLNKEELEKSNITYLFNNSFSQSEREYTINIIIDLSRIILLHEFTHLSNSHLDRINFGAMTDIEAELEADIYSFINSLHSEQKLIGANLFFDILDRLVKFIEADGAFMGDDNILKRYPLVCRSFFFSHHEAAKAVIDMERFIHASDPTPEWRWTPLLRNKDLGEECPLHNRAINQLASEIQEVEEWAAQYSFIGSPDEDERPHMLEAMALVDEELFHESVKKSMSLVDTTKMLKQTVAANTATIIYRWTETPEAGQLSAIPNGAISKLSAVSSRRALAQLHNGIGQSLVFDDESTREDIVSGLEFLYKATELLPHQANAWVGIAIAEFRLEDCPKAIRAAEINIEVASASAQPQAAELLSKLIELCE